MRKNFKTSAIIASSLFTLLSAFVQPSWASEENGIETSPKPTLSMNNKEGLGETISKMIAEHTDLIKQSEIALEPHTNENSLKETYLKIADGSFTDTDLETLPKKNVSNMRSYMKAKCKKILPLIHDCEKLIISAYATMNELK